MLMGELITLRQQRLPVKVVVLNNGALAFVELEMKADGIVTYGTDLDNPSFAEVAVRQELSIPAQDHRGAGHGLHPLGHPQHPLRPRR